MRLHLPQLSQRVALALLVLTSTTRVALVTPPGDVDIAFGTGGRVVTDFLGDDVARAVLVQPDGKIVVGGTRALNGNVDFAIARYDATTRAALPIPGSVRAARSRPTSAPPTTAASTT